MATFEAAFTKALQANDRKACVALVQSQLSDVAFDIKSLYEETLANSLKAIRTEETPIWKEHVQSNIVRTCIELCAPYVLEKAPATKRATALVLCQEEEYHEIGARMTADYLTLLGIDTYYIGANTPQAEALKAVAELTPALVCISISNYYHLTHLQVLIDAIKSAACAPAVVVGGYAITAIASARSQIQADGYASNYTELEEALYEIIL
ncbi:cobalamin B12-binding domain-containing protein [Fusibacter sp. JL298sf-3]